MIFQYTWPQVVAEQKTQTRRIVHSNEDAIRGRYNRIVSVMRNGREKWRVGKVYAVQPARGQRQIARIRLIRIRRERVARISQAEAKAEGSASRQAFLDAWRAIHGPGGEEHRVWVLEFELESVCVDHGQLEQLALPLDQVLAG